MTERKQRQGAGRAGQRLLALVLCLAALVVLAAGGVFIVKVLRGEWPAARSAASPAAPRVVILDAAWCDQLAGLESQQEIRQLISETLDTVQTLAGQGPAAVATAARTSDGRALFRDGTGTLSVAENVTAGDRFFSRFDPLQELIRQAAARGMPVYWCATDDAGAALAPGAALPDWAQKLVDRHGLAVLTTDGLAGDGAADSGSAAADADAADAGDSTADAAYGRPVCYTAGDTVLLGADTAPALAAAVAQQSDPAPGLVLGTWSALAADPSPARLVDRYLSGGALPDLSTCWTGKTIARTLAVTYPTPDGATVYTSALFLMGTSDPDSPLTLNGADVARYGADGVWGVLVDLEKGDNTFQLQNGSASLTYTVTYGTASGGGGSTSPKPDGSAGTEAVGKKVQITDAIASALRDYGDSSTISDTLFQGAVAEITGAVRYRSGSTMTHAYRLATGDYVRASACQVVDAPDAVFTGCTVQEDTASRCTVLELDGGTPAVVHTWEGNVLTLEFLSASYTGEAPDSGRFDALVQPTATGGFTLTLTFGDDDPLYGWAVNYDTDANRTTIWLKRTPRLSADPSAPLAGVTVMLDPGHGGSDEGAMGSAGKNAPLEKELNLAAAQAAKYRLEQLGATVVMTRTDDAFPSLGDRVTAMNEQHPDLFISLHHNSVELTRDVNQSGGTEAYWFYDEGETLADTLIARVCDATGRRNRGSAYGYYYVTRSNICPAVLLELGFVTNPAEYENCADPAYLWAEGGAIAQAVYDVIAANG